MSDQEYQWKVGDVCTCSYKTEGCVLYRVIEVIQDDRSALVRNAGNAILKIAPIHGVFTDISDRKNRTIGSSWCKPMDLITLGTEYMKLGNMIAEEASRRGAE